MSRPVLTLLSETGQVPTSADTAYPAAPRWDYQLANLRAYQCLAERRGEVPRLVRMVECRGIRLGSCTLGQVGSNHNLLAVSMLEC